MSISGSLRAGIAQSREPYRIITAYRDLSDISTGRRINAVFNEP
jgi:hypothetical protein